MRKIFIIQFILFLFCFCNCKENFTQYKVYKSKLAEKQSISHVNDKIDSFFTYKKWSSIDPNGIYEFSQFSVELKSYLDEKENVGGKKLYVNNKEIDLIVTDAYVLTPFLFVSDTEKIILIQEEDEGGIYGYILYYFVDERYVKKEYLYISPENQIEIQNFIKFKNDKNTILVMILTEKYYDTKTDKIKFSNQYNFRINKITGNAKIVSFHQNNVYKHTFYGVWKADCESKERKSYLLFNDEKEGYLYVYNHSQLVAKMMVELLNDGKSLQYVGMNIIGEGVNANELVNIEKYEIIAKLDTINNNLIFFWIGFSQQKILSKNPFGKENSVILKKCTQ
ncbi:hypothetical protein [Bergeyella zoohelcum]|uniref:Uncharacterized protein n=1 Tax=Bergeyella zoohelcum TaxID=1015 RepID=A0A380ZV88_9FLAO|nr:hypothetical protein [Bergeyella zoohelcum]EKB58888.1 hypothetical protein HMPREF9700_01735 [Bergeyella zoohelcum CCUG 30536]SUV53261.1 Uncharacterised protein [Bergeyella zoohelcum]